MNKFVLSLLATHGTVSLPATATSAWRHCSLGQPLKVMQVPAHLYIVEAAGINGGTTKNAEEMYLNGITFVMVDGKWRKSPVSPKELADAKKSRLKSSAIAPQCETKS